MAHRILLVDDDMQNLEINKRVLKMAGYSVFTVSSGADAIQEVAESKHDYSLVLMDYRMEPMNGIEATRQLKEISPSLQVVMFSHDDTREVLKQSFKAGAIDFLDKNSDNDELLAAVAACCAKYDDLYRKVGTGSGTANDRTETIRAFGMIGRSEQMFDLCKQIGRVASSQASALILGESGTGKELVAQAIHKNSPRSKGPFIAINIAAESATLLDSNLFGHKRGAFTGAIADHPGRFKQADGGTIFLDEIGDMSLDLQVKLLRVLQERTVTPVGATKEIAIDVRVIAATHKNLEAMVASGQFREDLYYRINTLILKTTPLRERPDDIEPLVAQFTSDVCKANGFRKAFNHRCLDVFRNNAWKGNVRELRSVVERHLVDSDSREIGPEHLEANLFSRVSISSPKTLEEIDSHLEEVKREMLRKTLVDSGSKANAARTLKIAPNRLSYYLEKLGLKDVI